jgi:hypothetical protein
MLAKLRTKLTTSDQAGTKNRTKITFSSAGLVVGTPTLPQIIHAKEHVRVMARVMTEQACRLYKNIVSTKEARNSPLRQI